MKNKLKKLTALLSITLIIISLLFLVSCSDTDVVQNPNQNPNRQVQRLRNAGWYIQSARETSWYDGIFFDIIAARFSLSEKEYEALLDNENNFDENGNFIWNEHVWLEFVYLFYFDTNENAESFRISHTARQEYNKASVTIPEEITYTWEIFRTDRVVTEWQRLEGSYYFISNRSFYITSNNR